MSACGPGLSVSTTCNPVQPLDAPDPWNIASVGSEMLGGLGYTDESLVGKLLRDMRHVSIAEGGDDVLRELIFGRYVTKSPRARP